MNEITWNERTIIALKHFVLGDAKQRLKARLHFLDMANRLDDLGELIKKGLQ